MAWTVLSLILSMSVAGGLMIILTFTVNALLCKKASFKWRYYIWIVALTRLLLPFAPEVNLMTYLGEHINYITQTGVANFNSTNTSKIPEDIQKDINSSSSLQEDTVKSEEINKNNILKSVWNIKGYLCIFWAMMALLFFIQKVTVYRHFIKFVRAGSTPIDDINQLEILSKAEIHLGIKKPVDLWTNPLVASPMLIGFIHPRIVLPNALLPEQEFYYTVLHELMHYKRKDMYYKWLTQTIICIHWFNPLVYIAGRSINHLCEFSCDEAVTTRLQSTEQLREYATTLLNAMASSGVYKEHIATLTLSENKKLLKERMEAIMNNKRTNTISKVLLAILTVIITFTGIFTGGYTADASNSLNINNITELRQKKNSSTNSKSDTITAAQADKMALALTDKIWVWDWIEFFVPYMSEKGVQKLIPASRNASWAGSVDMTTGKKIKFTKKQINAARKHKPSGSLTCGDIDKHALMIMQSNGDWECISFMLPYMSHKGIRAVVRCYNSKHGKDEKKAKDYF